MHDASQLMVWEEGAQVGNCYMTFSSFACIGQTEVHQGLWTVDLHCTTSVQTLPQPWRFRHVLHLVS